MKYKCLLYHYRTCMQDVQN